MVSLGKQSTNRGCPTSMWIFRVVTSLCLAWALKLRVASRGGCFFADSSCRHMNWTWQVSAETDGSKFIGSQIVRSPTENREMYRHIYIYNDINVDHGQYHMVIFGIGKIWLHDVSWIITGLIVGRKVVLFNCSTNPFHINIFLVTWITVHRHDAPANFTFFLAKPTVWLKQTSYCSALTSIQKTRYVHSWIQKTTN